MFGIIKSWFFLQKFVQGYRGKGSVSLIKLRAYRLPETRMVAFISKCL